MTIFVRHAAALAFTTLASALLLVGAVGPASQAPTPVASTARIMA
ncbi:hypothetical protein [Sphingomonas bacterium]|nr:hypothetical protein [Sphingomonas bacterium]